jgi:hypothetical protein
VALSRIAVYAGKIGSIDRGHLKSVSPRWNR